MKLALLLFREYDREAISSHSRKGYIMREFINRKFKSFWAVALLIGGIAVLALLLLLQRPKPAQAFPSDLDAAEAQYPVIVGERIDNCFLCHVNASGGPRNPYGSDFAAHGRDFTAIENIDLDSDGILNIDEINALTYPGDPDDPPAATSTPTATVEAPTDTPTPTGEGATATPTATGEEPTATPTATGEGPTATPTATGEAPTATPTATAEGPTATPTEIGEEFTATPNATDQTPIPTDTPTATPRPTAISGSHLVRLPVVFIYH